MEVAGVPVSEFFTAGQLVAHGVGDYLMQSHWMATRKTSSHLAAAAHALTYGVPFLFLRPSPLALAVIVGTHFLLDRYRLARFLVYAKNCLAPHPWAPWAACQSTGYPPDAPPWLAVWLLIIADNLVHVVVNALALSWMP